MKGRPVMTRAMLTKIAAQRCNTKYDKADMIIHAAFTIMKSELAQGGKVQINSFGIFETVWRKEKAGNDMSRNQPITIPARTIPVFRPSKIFKKRIENVKPCTND